jgi:predicted Zn-dependent peptidase
LSIIQVGSFSSIIIQAFHSFTLNRDTFIYAASIETSALDTAIKVLGEVILRPKLTPQEVS